MESRLTGMMVFICAAVLAVAGVVWAHGGDLEVPNEHSNAESHETVILTKAQQEAIGLKTVPVVERTIRKTVAVNGTVRPMPGAYALVTTPFPGTVTRTFVMLGQSVKAGQPLVALASPEAERTWADYRAAASRLALARQERDRVRTLVEKKIAAGKDLLQRESELRIAQSEVEGFKQQLSGLDFRPDLGGVLLRSPVGGVVAAHHAVDGESVDRSMTLFEVGTISTVLVEGEAFEDLLGLLKKGLGVSVQSQAMDGPSLSGEIIGVADQLDPQNGSLKFWAKVKNGPDRPLRPNLFVRITVNIGAGRRALALPKEALFLEQGKTFVFVKNGPGFVLTDVRIGSSDATYAEVLDGLFPGDEVVTVGKRELYTQSLFGGKPKGDVGLGGDTD